MKIEEKDIPLLIRQGNDKPVIELLYKNVFPKVKNYIGSNGGITDDANDIFQDALLFFYNQMIRKKFNQDKYNVYGYLYRLSINRWLNKIKKHNRITLVDAITDSNYTSQTTEDYSTIDLLKKEENLIKNLFSSITK